MFLWMGVHTEGFLSKQQHPFTIKSFHGFRRPNVKRQFLEMLEFCYSTVTEGHAQVL